MLHIVEVQEDFMNLDMYNFQQMSSAECFTSFIYLRLNVHTMFLIQLSKSTAAQKGSVQNRITSEYYRKLEYFR